MTEEEYILSLVRSEDVDLRTLGCVTLAAKGLEWGKGWLGRYGVSQAENKQSGAMRFSDVSDIIDRETKVNNNITLPVMVVKGKDFWVVSYKVTWIGGPEFVYKYLGMGSLDRDLKIIE